MNVSGSLFALLASISWAISAFPITKSGRAMTVASMNLVRLGLATLIILLIVLCTSFHDFTGIFSGNYINGWIWLGLSGLTALGIGDYFSYRMYTILGPRNGSALATISPASALIFGIIILNEHINLVGILGMAITIMGVLSMSLGPTERKSLPDHGHGTAMSGIIFGIIGSLCNGAGIVFSKKAFLLQENMGYKIDPMTASFIRFLVATVAVYLVTIVCGRFSFQLKNIFRQPSRILWSAFGGIIFGPVLGVGFALTSIQYINVAVAQTIFALVPVIALLIAHFVYKEKITKYALAGVLVAIAGVAILIWREMISTVVGL